MIGSLPQSKPKQNPATLDPDYLELGQILVRLVYAEPRWDFHWDYEPAIDVTTVWLGTEDDEVFVAHAQNANLALLALITDMVRDLVDYETLHA